MAVTTVSDIAEALNTPFNLRWLQEYSTQNSALYRSGIVARDPDIQTLVRQTSAQGKVGPLSFFKDLTGDDVPLSQSVGLTPDAITGDKDQYVIHRRGKAFGASDLAGIISGGGDVVGRIRTLIGDFQVRARQKMLRRTLKGVFANNALPSSDNGGGNDGDLIFDITGGTGNAAYLDTFSLLDAAQLLGDAKGMLTAIVCHSAVELQLNKLGAKSQTYRPADERAGVLASYNGKALIMDDDLAYNPSTGVTEYYLFARGAVAEASAVPTENFPAFEVERKGTESKTILIARDAYVMHVRGVKFIGSTDADSPANATIEAGASWKRVYDRKHIRVVKVVCKVGNLGSAPVVDGGGSGSGGSDSGGSGSGGSDSGGSDASSGG